MAGGPRRARQARGRAGGAKRGAQEQASRSPLGPGREGVRVRHRGRHEDSRGALRGALTAARLQHHVRPDYTLGACPGCTSLADGLDGSLVHLNHRDVTLLCFSRAPIERLTSYKERMGWQFNYVSTYNTDFPFDFNLAMTDEQAQQIPEVKEMIDKP